MNRIDIDFGNGQLKYIANARPVIVPAYIAPVFDAAKFSQCPVFSLVTSSSGTNRNGDSWVAGQDALDFAPKDAVRVGSVPQSKGKAKYALKQLASIVQPIDQTIVPNCSVPDMLRHGAELRSALVGRHTITRNGVPFTLTIPDVSLRPEGFGAVYSAIATGLAPGDRKNAGLDIGSQTAILSGFNSQGVEIDTMRRVIDTGGTRSLFARIGSHSAVTAAFGGELSPDLVEREITRSLHSPNIDGFGVDPIYRQVKTAWLQNIVDECGAVLGDVFGEIGSIVCFGGGVELVRHDLEKLPKAVVLGNAQTANVTGLAALPLAQSVTA
jgi:hypothetical protein